jgi:hypothetical protein
MSIERNKFSGTKLSVINDTVKKAESNSTQIFRQDGSRVDFHKIEDGKNTFRIFPAHNWEKDPPYRAFRTVWLKCMLPEWVDGKETNKLVEKNKKIFIATQHGNQEKDIIESYLEFVKELSESYDSKEEREKFLAPVKGYTGKDKKWVSGIQPSTTYVCYAIKNGTLGRLELWPKWRKEMERLVLSEDSDEAPIETDVFSDPNEGYPLIITKTKNDKGKYDYVIEKENLRRGENWDKFFERTKITDAQWAEWEKQESLTELYTDCYTTRDFELAMNGLQIFDKLYKYNIFENDEFQQLAKELKSKLREPDKKEESENKVGKSGTEDIDKAFDSENSKNVEDWPKFKCKKFLKNYVVANYDGEDQEPYLQEIEKLDMKDLHAWCELAVKEEELPYLEQEETEVDEDIVVPEDVEVVEEESTVERAIETVINRPRRQR